MVRTSTLQTSIHFWNIFQCSEHSIDQLLPQVNSWVSWSFSKYLLLRDLCRVLVALLWNISKLEVWREIIILHFYVQQKMFAYWNLSRDQITFNWAKVLKTMFTNWTHIYRRINCSEESYETCIWILGFLSAVELIQYMYIHTTTNLHLWLLALFLTKL